MVRSIAVMLGLILVIPAHAGSLGGVDMGREIESRRRDADREVALFSWSTRARRRTRCSDAR